MPVLRLFRIELTADCGEVQPRGFRIAFAHLPVGLGRNGGIDRQHLAPAIAALPCASHARRGTPPAFMPPSITSSLPVT